MARSKHLHRLWRQRDLILTWVYSNSLCGSLCKFFFCRGGHRAFFLFALSPQKGPSHVCFRASFLILLSARISEKKIKCHLYSSFLFIFFSFHFFPFIFLGIPSCFRYIKKWIEKEKAKHKKIKNYMNCITDNYMNCITENYMNCNTEKL